MSQYQIKTVLANTVNQINDFAKHHQDEDFYAFSIDDGMLCLSSEQGFNKVIEKYSNDWIESHEKIKTKEDLEDYELEFMKELYEGMPKDMLEDMDISCLDDYIDSELEMENEINQDALKEGNPYKKQDEINTLRNNTGDWPYQGFEDLNFDDSPVTLAEEYIITEQELQNSDYAQTIKNLLTILERNKDKAFASLKCTKDFEIFKAKHQY